MLTTLEFLKTELQHLITSLEDEATECDDMRRMEQRHYLRERLRTLAEERRTQARKIRSILYHTEIYQEQDKK
jgi:hypothetical protein